MLKWLREMRLAPAATTPGRYLEGLRAEKRTATIGKIRVTQGLPAAKQLAWLFVKNPSVLQSKDAPTLAHVLQDVEVAHVYKAARTFVDMVRHKQPEVLDPWLEACAGSSVKALRTFAVEIRQDYRAVPSALELPWSNAPTEGHVTRLKFINLRVCASGCCCHHQECRRSIKRRAEGMISGSQARTFGQQGVSQGFSGVMVSQLPTHAGYSLPFLTHQLESSGDQLGMLQVGGVG